MPEQNFRTVRLMLRASALLVLALLSGGRALPPDHKNEPQWHPVASWQQAQGLPQDCVYSLLQTRDGYIWVGTKGGVARFDGVRFTTFDDRNRNHLRENEVWALAEGDDGSLWIGTFGGGVSRLKNGQFAVYTSRDGLANDFVGALCSGNDGSMWIATEGGLSHFKDGRFINYKVRDGLAHDAVRALYCDRDGSIWIGTVKGTIHRFKDGKIHNDGGEGPKPSAEIKSICRDREQSLWIASHDGLFRLMDGKFTRFTTRDGLSANWISRVFVDPQGKLWAGTDKGLDLYNNDTSSFQNVVPKYDINAICSDHEGSLWIGSSADGISRLLQGQFVSYSVSEGLASYYAASIIQSKNGDLWVGTSKGLNRFREGKFTTCASGSGLPPRMVSALAEDRRGTLWVGTESGLYRSRSPIECDGERCDPEFIPVKNDSSLETNIKIIYEDKEGSIWIGTDHEGLVRYKDDRFTTWTTGEGLSSNVVRSMCEDRDGNLWVGTRGGGLNRFRDGKFTTFTENDGLASNGVQALYRDQDNTLWIGTRQGVNRFKDGRFTTYRVNDGLFANFVYSIVEDNKGNLWMSCSKGVFRVSRQQLNDFADGKVRSVTSVAYGIEHGLGSSIGTVGNHPESCKSSDGRIWFCTYKGVSAIDPEKLTANALPPPVHIEEVSIDQQAFISGEAVSAPPGRGDITIRYTGLSFLAPEKVRFKYKLEGYDPDWVDAGDRRAAYYSNIPPGRYTFRVMAANNDGRWNETGDTRTLYLAPHFYQTGWFYGLCICAAALLIAGAYRLRVRSLKAREQQLELLVDQRTKELQEQQALLQEQRTMLQDQRGFLRKVVDLNPSFIFAKDRQGRFTLANRALAEACGTTADDLIGKTAAE
ncbi:MAG TPA: two-component regulator propeller domain-containing protein, partial [Blastocatellia bacterium]|nr:two-component regulator propeller domain-containing protein [Blastocatellia bacterium]